VGRNASITTSGRHRLTIRPPIAWYVVDGPTKTRQSPDIADRQVAEQMRVMLGAAHPTVPYWLHPVLPTADD